ncbi:glycosyltransferase family 4 protein [Rugosimonospora africana]|uniref:Glycosyl transferase n=1 Tax=Rugosimonospora africana TaxID=556532 RepID=A0A8J3R495_9ACTN|nr:glycosyltransferase family 4 protein [Rugosimonospora africana]GIH21065.1 glycosyl transferase [Rugosimonospora africana]
MVVPPWYEVPPLGYGGVEVIAGALVDALVARGHEVTLFGAGSRTGTAASHFIASNPSLQHARLGQLLPALVHTARVNKLMSEGEYDVVHDHTTDGPVTAAMRKAPTVVTVHGIVNSDLGDFLDALGDSVRLVAISRSQRQSRPSLPWAATVHNALPYVDPVDAPQRHDGPVLWLARFSPDKGPDLAIQACREAGLPLVLAGKASEPSEAKYLEEEIRPMLRDDDDIQLLADADRTVTDKLLAEARCLIMPIRWDEPFGMVMIEAMAVGTPVVALSRGAVPELIRDGLTGWVRGRPEDLPAALHRIDEIDPADCVAHVRANFSAPLMARRYERVYLEAVDAAMIPGRRRRMVDSRPQPVPVLRRPDRRMPYVG